MKELLLLALLLPHVLNLTCSLYYDYSQPTVRCAQNCPPSTTLIGVNCLAYNHYLINSQVFACWGYVSADRSMCCPYKHFIQNSNCLACRGQVYNNGLSCCTDDNYLDLTQETPNCVAVSTGNCPSLLLSTVFKICCPRGKMYYLLTGQCVEPNGFNCDSSYQICCSSTQRLQYMNRQYLCVNQCSWTPFSSTGLFCQKQYCSQLSQTLRTITPAKSSTELISFGDSCCIGLDSTSQCIRSIDSCMSRFANRGWSICCQIGYFYSPGTQKCVNDCQGGSVVFGSVCVGIGKQLDLTGSRPSEGNLYSTCNGVALNTKLPVCCPTDFFIQDNTGCKFCNGNIFTLIGYQVCCSKQQYFNATSATCGICDGSIDASGQLCCPSGTYIYYDAAGKASCSNGCSLDNMYNAKACCQSLTLSCSATFLANGCNPSYYNTQACRGCPAFCTANEVCSSSQQSPCNSTCPINQVATQGIGCLQCDLSCNGCSAPLDPARCLTCAVGYTLVQSKCQICAGNCISCYLFTDYCTSCEPNIKVLIGTKCYSACLLSGYYLDSSTLTCVSCSSQCVECLNNKANCTMCQDSTFLNQGTCTLCDFSCASCSGSSKTCTKCITGYIKNVDGTCSQQCIGISVTQYVNGPLCLPCHPSCTGCTLYPQNCYSCSSNLTYLNGSLGMNICDACKSPCVTCTGITSCTSCVNGFFLNVNNCTKCDISCQTCNGPSNSNCLSCFEGSNLTTNGYCSGCSKSCNICNGTTCTSCISGFILYQGNCITTCPAQTYYQAPNCLNCDPTCSQCNATLCTKCAPNYLYVLNKVCYTTCPSNYSPSGDTCIKNTPPTPPPTPPPPPPPPPPKNDTNNTKNDTNGTTPNNTDPTVISGPSINQAIVIAQGKIFFNVYLPDQKAKGAKVRVNLINSRTGERIALQPSDSIHNQSNNKICFIANLPDKDLTGFSLIQTNAEGPNINITQVTSQPSNQLVVSSYMDDTLSNMKIFGYVFSPIMLVFIVLTKVKGHYSAEQANNIILHSFNFGQVCYFFKFATNLESGGYFFLNGFGVSHLTFFPNFFSSLISPFYVQNTVQKTLVPDGNLLRNAGFTFSYQLIMVFLLIVAVVVAVLYSKSQGLQDYPHLRKIMRLGILLIHIGFMNQLFFAFVQIIQPTNPQTEYQAFYNANLGCSYMLILLIPILMAVVLYHYYQTYNSDVLEHYYTLREASLFLIIYAQAIIMCLSVGKPLVGLFLIPLEIVWFVFNYLLYRYGSGLTLSDFKKYFIVSGVISISYVFLSLEGILNWLCIVIAVSFASVALIVYCGYQLVGIYYHKIFSYDNDKEVHQN